MIDADVEVLYEDDEKIVIRLAWVMNGVHGEKIITEEKT